MTQIRNNLLWWVFASLLICGCGKVTQEQEAQSLFDKGEFEQAIRTADGIIDQSRDHELVFDMQVLRGRCLIELAHAARKSGDDDSATRHLDQAIVVTTAAIDFQQANPDFRKDDPGAFYCRSDAYDMLGQTQEAYQDRIAGKSIDPDAKLAHTNEFLADDVALEQQYNVEFARLNEKKESPEGLLAENDEDKESSDDPYGRETERNEPYTYDPDRPDRDPNRDELDENDDNQQPRRTRKDYAFSRKNEESDEEDSDAGAADANEEEGLAGRQRPRRSRDSMARSPDSLEPLDPSPDDNDPDRPGGQSPFPYSARDIPPTFTPIRPPSTGVTGNNYSRLQPSFNPQLPTTGYTGGPLNGSGPNGLPPQSSGRGALASGPSGPTTGYSGSRFSGPPPTNFNRAPSYRPLPSASIGSGFTSSLDLPSGNFGYSGALPYSERRQFGGQQTGPITTPYQAPPEMSDPYSSVPRVPTMRDFYSPPPISPNAVPTTSIYGQ